MVTEKQTSIDDEYSLLRDTNRLQAEGIMLFDSLSKTGRVVFSLQELPLRVNFVTPTQQHLQRLKETQVSISHPHSGNLLANRTIELSCKLDSSNKDQFLWAQRQSDLSLLNNDRLVAENGIKLRDQISGTTEQFHSLKELPIGVKYFTENDNILVRTSQYQVSVADSVIRIGIPPTRTDSGTLSNFTPGNVTDGIPDDLLQEVAKLIMESPDFPKITKCKLGTRESIYVGYHTSEFLIDYEYQGGVEGNSIIRWERSTGKSQPFSPIQGVSGVSYSPSIADIGSILRVVYTPVRADGVAGAIAYSNMIKVRMDPEIQAEVRCNTLLNTLMIKVLLRNGNEFQKRSIVLDRQKLKIRKRLRNIVKISYRHLKVTPHIDNGCLFTIEVPQNKTQFVFVTPSSVQRDIIILSIQAFQAASESNCNFTL